MAGVAVAKHSFLAALQSVIGRENEVTLKADSESISKASEKTRELGITPSGTADFVESETPNDLSGRESLRHTSPEGGEAVFAMPEVTRPEWGFSESDVDVGNAEERDGTGAQASLTFSKRDSEAPVDSQFPNKELYFDVIEHVDLAGDKDEISNNPKRDSEQTNIEPNTNSEIFESAERELPNFDTTHWRDNHSNQGLHAHPAKNVTVSRSAPSVESPSLLFKTLDRVDESSFFSGISKSTNEDKTRPNKSFDSWASKTGTKGLNRIDGTIEFEENRGPENDRINDIEGFRLPTPDAAVSRDNVLAVKPSVEYPKGENRSPEHSKFAVPSPGVAPLQDSRKVATDIYRLKLIPDDMSTVQQNPSVKKIDNPLLEPTNWAQPSWRETSTASKPEMSENRVSHEQRLHDRAHRVEIKEVGPIDLPRTRDIETKLQQQPGFQVPLETGDAAVDPEGGFDRLPNSALVGSTPRVEQVAQNAVRAVLMSIQSPSVQDEGRAQASSAVSVEIDTVSDHLEIRFHADKRDTVDLLSRFQFQLEGELRRSGVENFSLSFSENRDREGRHGPERLSDIRVGANDDNNDSLAVPRRVYSDAVLDRLV